MAGDDALTDAERISIGRKPFQGEQLYDRDDLAVLERLGHEPGDHIPMVVRDSVNRSCPLDGCEGSLGLIDRRMRNLPTNPYALDDTVSVGKKTYISLTEAQSPSEPLVACHKCGNAFEASFRRLRDPEEYSLPEPRIVETDHTLHGAPRIDGTRIGVQHVMSFHEQATRREKSRWRRTPS